jgi:hypothetical protein
VKIGRILPILVCALTSAIGAIGQSAASPVTTALQTSITGMLGTNNVQDVTLTGTVTAIAGSDDENGTFTFRATSTGSSRIDLGLSSATRSETRLLANGMPSGQWSNGTAVTALAQHNLFTGLFWPFPAYTLQTLLNDPTMTVTFVGQEGSLLHLAASGQQAGVTPTAASLHQALTQIDFWLDSTTFLPAQMLFNVHPDSNAALNIPVLVEFSNYQMIDGITTATHVQKYINNTLTLDIQVQSLATNSGLNAATFTLQ